MASPFRKLPAHSPVTAFSITAYNRMIDMLNWWQTNQTRLGGGPIGGIVDWDQTVFRVKNTTGRDLVSYDPVGLDGPIFDIHSGGEAEFANQTSQIGTTPSIEDHAGGKWGVMLECAGQGRIGRCCIAGVVPVRVYVSATTDKCVDVIEAETVSDETVYLGTGGGGSQLLWLDPTAEAEGVAWAIVRLGAAAPPSLTPAILYDDVAPGDTGKYAYLCNADGTANTTADKITLDNTHPGNFRGYGSSHSGFDETTAAKVLYTTVNGVNMIVGSSGCTIARGTLSASLSKGSSANASLTIDGVSVTVTVYDCLMKSGATAIASGKKIIAQYFASENKWYVTEAECA